jgi:hypothetical protein
VVLWEQERITLLTRFGSGAAVMMTLCQEGALPRSVDTKDSILGTTVTG